MKMTWAACMNHAGADYVVLIGYAPMPVAYYSRLGVVADDAVLIKGAASMHIGAMLTIIQVFFAAVIGIYFWNLLKNQQGSKSAVDKEARKETEKLRRLRNISLTEPLAEKTRPTTFDDIVGQVEGLKALRAALCGPNPQHVIIYGPPGVGKTAAARLVLEEAKRNPASPFGETAKFVEMDATIARFDERGIADPLIGSVHDPIYQGAGPLGIAGIPQPKPGAVTKAHGGVLFLDEIGELHPVQMNKLLKVLEDRKVFLESAYYSPEDTNVPAHIHDIFANGLPADFRLVGATTRLPQEIPAAIRSRCLEVFFQPLRPHEIGRIARNAARKVGVAIDDGAVAVIQRFATNGREAVNIIQIAAGLAQTAGDRAAKSGGAAKSDEPAAAPRITRADVEWVVSAGQYQPRIERHVPAEPQIGYVNGLAVAGPGGGVLLEVEVTAVRARRGRGRLTVTGVIEEEEVGGPGRVLRRQSMARGAVENVLTVLRAGPLPDVRDYDLHVNFPGGVPVDGPSAGVAVAVAICSAVRQQATDHLTAMTGELSIRGHIKPVGGVAAKVEAARLAGCKRVIIPAENWQERFGGLEGIEVVPVATLAEALALVLPQQETAESWPALQPAPVLAATPAQDWPGSV